MGEEYWSTSTLMPLDNCRHCHKPFNRVAKDLCADCSELHEAVNRHLYHIIQENPGITLHELAQKVNISLQEVQKRVFNAELGTASQLVSSKCARCEEDVIFYQSMSRYCEKCSSHIKSEINLAKHIEQERLRKGSDYPGLHTTRTKKR